MIDNDDNDNDNDDGIIKRDNEEEKGAKIEITPKHTGGGGGGL
jgi:hypothetical protein